MGDTYCLAALQLRCLAPILTLVKAREVNRRIEQNGGEHVRTVGSHKRYRVTRGDVVASTAVPQHPGDIPTGTLHKIEKDLAPVLGKGWLT